MKTTLPVRLPILPVAFAACLLLAASLTAETAAWTDEGVASWYGAEFKGRPTSSGEIFDPEQFTAAHKTLPFGTRVVVTNLDTGASTTVRINDRGPFVAGRLIDLSQAAARSIDLMAAGTARVRLSLPQVPASAPAAAPAPQPAPAAAPAAPAVAVLAAPPAAVNPAPAAAVGPAAPAETPNPTRLIQIAAFSSQVNAHNLIDSLAASGLGASLESAGPAGPWRVVLAGIPAAQVEITVAKLRTLGISQVLVRQR